MLVVVYIKLLMLAGPGVEYEAGRPRAGTHARASVNIYAGPLLREAPPAAGGSD